MIARRTFPSNSSVTCMSTITPTHPTTAPLTLASPAVYRLSVDEYERIADTGILGDARVELIDGLLVKKITQNPPHTWTVETIDERLSGLLPTAWFTREEKPVRIPQFDEPEPDISVVRGTRDDYLSHHPGPADLALLVEVADSSLDYDRGEKLVAYAKGRVTCYWIVNLVHRQVEVYTNPELTGYQSIQIYKSGQNVPVVFDGIELGRLEVAEILPRTS
jgi:Uma2 family endonuclease